MSNTYIRFLNTNGVILLVIIATLYVLIIENERVEALRVLASVLIASIFALVLKELFGVPRPFLVNNKDALAGLTQLSSFPSMHSAIAFSAATTVSFQGKKFGLILIVLAVLIAVGRVLANVHYPVDIFFGILIGVLISHVVENIQIFTSIKGGSKK